jgi:alpha-mannosidase
MRAAGQDCYVMMRPQEWEMPLPSRLFRWCGEAGGPEVTVFRIASSYDWWQPTVEDVQTCLGQLPEGVAHTMFFVGAGDHGGGATERQIAWCREHANAIGGVRLVFSSPARFFDAVAGLTQSLPVVAGELQHHAIGCYTVHRSVKTAVRRAEHLLAQAEVAVAAVPLGDEMTTQRLGEAWEAVAFNHFHDTLGGTCVPSAYPQVDAQLGMARAIADDIIHTAVRSTLPTLPDDRLQRIVLFNASDASYEGYCETEPWIFGPWNPQWRLLDDGGCPVDYQLLSSEAAVVGGPPRLLFRLACAPAATSCLRIDRSEGIRESLENQPATSSTESRRGPFCTRNGSRTIANRDGVTVRLEDKGGFSFPGGLMSLPELDLIDDTTDTWSHGIDRYPEAGAATVTWDAPQCLDSGPLMVSLVREGEIGRSLLHSEHRVYAGEPFVEWLLRVTWSERRKLLKMRLDLPATLGPRHDGIPGGDLVRPPTGQERPLRDRTLLRLSDGSLLGVVCPDVFAIDALPQRVRFTLLRSPCMALHDPHPCTGPRGFPSDQGVHLFRFRFFLGNSVEAERLDREALMLQRPLAVADLTRGMPAGTPLEV